MPSSPHFRVRSISTVMNKTNFVISLLCVAVIGIIGLSFGNPRYKGHASPTLDSGSDGRVAVMQDQNVEVEVITAIPEGFEPTAITRPRGPFVLALHNRSGERELVLRIHRDSMGRA
jgi:hypothetical protein